MIKLGVVNASMQYPCENLRKTPTKMTQYIPMNCLENYVVAIGGEL